MFRFLEGFVWLSFGDARSLWPMHFGQGLKMKALQEFVHCVSTVT